MDKFCLQFQKTLRDKRLSGGYCSRVDKHVPLAWCFDVCQGDWRGDVNEDGYAKIEPGETPVDDGSLVSAIICARNEPDLDNTIQSLQDNAIGNLEIVVVLDGGNGSVGAQGVKWISLPEAVGFREAMNTAAAIAKGDYLFFVDAHCRMSPEWDVKLKEITSDHSIAVSIIESLRSGAKYSFAKLDDEFQDKWWGANPNQTEQLVDPTPAFTGCGWMIKRDTFIELGGADVALGKYGHTGSEWSIKLPMEKPFGEILLRKDVVCKHDFGTNKGGQRYPAEKISQDDFRHWALSKYGTGIKKIYDRFNLPWNVDFKTIIRCVDGSCRPSISKACLDSLKQAAGQHRIITVEKPDGQKRCLYTYYGQLLAGLSQVKDEWVWIAEQDVLYSKEHFDFTPDENVFYYDTNGYRLTRSGYCPLNSKVMSMLAAPRRLLIQALQERRNAMDKGWEVKASEPSQYDPETQFESRTYKASIPSLDIRHDKNYTGDRKCNTIESVGHWGSYKKVWEMLVPELKMNESKLKSTQDKLEEIFSGYWNLIKGAKTEEIQRRIDICMDCQYRRHRMGIDYCGVCKCPIQPKVRSATSQCPMEYWKREGEE